jgi:hypothetical protein
MRTIIVADGYNGSTIELDAEDILDSMSDGTVKLHVIDKPWLIRWVRAEDILTAEECDDQEPLREGPDTHFLFH